MYSNASGARMGQLKPRSGYNPPAGGGYTAETFPSSGGSGRRYARPKKQSRASKPANGVTRSAPISGDDVTAAVIKAVRADGNASFADWRSSLQRQGWGGDPSKIKYDPATGKFVDTGVKAAGVKAAGVKAAGAKAASGTASGGDVTPEQTEAQVSHRAESLSGEVQPGENLGDLDGQLTAEIEKRRNMPGGQKFLNTFQAKAKEFFNRPEYKALSDVEKNAMMLGWLRDMNNNPDKYPLGGAAPAPKSEPQAQTPAPVSDVRYVLKPGVDHAPQPVYPSMSAVDLVNAVRPAEPQPEPAPEIVPASQWGNNFFGSLTYDGKRRLSPSVPTAAATEPNENTQIAQRRAISNAAYQQGQAHNAAERDATGEAIARLSTAGSAVPHADELKRRAVADTAYQQDQAHNAAERDATGEAISRSATAGSAVDSSAYRPVNRQDSETVLKNIQDSFSWLARFAPDHGAHAIQTVRDYLYSSNDPNKFVKAQLYLSSNIDDIIAVNNANIARGQLAGQIADISDYEQLYGNSGNGAVSPQSVEDYYNRGRRK